MKKIIILSLLVLAIVALPLLAACDGQEPTSAPTTGAPAITSTPAATSTPSANWWDKFGEPQYGGTITIHATTLDVTLDPHAMGNFTCQFWFDRLFDRSWTVAPEVWPFRLEYCPAQYYSGLLAESWEQTDPLTVTVYIRKGIKWQNLPPVNGREFTAYDVQFTVERMLGQGNFTQPYWMYPMTLTLVDHAVATDDYTVVFYLKKSGPLAMDQVMQTGSGSMIAPEWVEQGDTENWKNAVGTGPWLLTEFVKGSSMTMTKNPDYWGYDERYPENRLPYADEFKVLAIPDMSTTLAAMRTGKIDYVGGKGGPTLVDAKSLANTNPDINIEYLPTDGYAINLYCDEAPFNDIRVRKALQMSIDRKTIAETHYMGMVDGTPSGLMSPEFKGYVTPYDQWPADLQQEYSYNTPKAKQLLTDAGYPDGFKTTVYMSSADDIALLEIIKSYFLEIGVDMEIQTMDMATFFGARSGGVTRPADFSLQTSMGMSPSLVLTMFLSTNLPWGPTINDATYDAMYDEVLNTTSVEDLKKAVNDIDLYALKQHYAINVFGNSSPVFWQPWLSGYDGRTIYISSPYWARFWVDQGLKASMGY